MKIYLTAVLCTLLAYAMTNVAHVISGIPFADLLAAMALFIAILTRIENE